MNGVGAFDAAPDALGKQSKVVCEGSHPGGGLWAAGEGAILVEVTGDGVEDGVNLGQAWQFSGFVGVADLGQDGGEISDEARAEVVVVGPGLVVFDDGRANWNSSWPFAACGEMAARVA